MKTTKIILGIVGLALTTIAFGQLLSKNSDEILYYSAAYNTENHRLEHRLNELPPRIYMHVSYDRAEIPLLTRAYFNRNIKSESWDRSTLEDWMITPFETEIYDNDLSIESWMLTPFESTIYEMEPALEPWMINPFDLEEEIKMEGWMTMAWV